MSCITTADPALVPDIEAFEERAAIMVHEGGLPTDQAKNPAAQARGFRHQAHYWAWLRVYVERKRLGYKVAIPEKIYFSLKRGWAY